MMKLLFGSILVFSSLLNASEIGFGTYGNWCGIDHPVDPKTAAAPIDPLDSVCQRHDQCYVAKGAFSCECDAVLQQEISDGLKASLFQAEAKHFARSAHHYFKGSPCNGIPKTKLAPTRVIQTLLKNGKNLVDKIVPGDKSSNSNTVVENNTDQPAKSQSESAPDSATTTVEPTTLSDGVTK